MHFLSNAMLVFSVRADGTITHQQEWCSEAAVDTAMMWSMARALVFLCGQQHDSLSAHHAHSLYMPLLYDDVHFPDSKYCAVQMLLTHGITYSSLICLTAKKVTNECVCHEQCSIQVQSAIWRKKLGRHVLKVLLAYT